MESKTYVFGENGNNGMMSLLAPLMQKSGLDPNLLLAMNRNNGGFGGEGGWFMWVIFGEATAGVSAATTAEA